MTEPDTINNNPPHQRLFWGFFAASIVITLIIYWGVTNYQFTNWDDPVYTTNNTEVTNLNSVYIKKQFRVDNYVLGNYIPLTMLSYALEYRVYKSAIEKNNIVWAKITHRDNLILHLINIGLVFWMVWLLTGRLSIGVITAVLFGIHPMHVESVAWIVGRKDLLFALFYFGATISYLMYLKSKKTRFVYYPLILILFTCSLLSKGLAVTFPVVLLLIDYLNRRKPTLMTILEKVPLFILAITFGLIAIKAPAGISAFGDIGLFSFIERLTLAGSSLFTYIVKFIVPIDLANFYPLPNSEEALPVSYYIRGVLGVTLVGLVIYWARKSRKLLFGSAYFLVTIVLTLQVIPFGNVLMADRHSYVSFIGLFLLVGFAYDYTEQNYVPTARKFIKRIKPAFIIMLFAAALIFGRMSWNRVQVWDNSVKLWSDMINKYPDLAMARNYRALGFISQKRYKIAMADLNEATKIDKNFDEAYSNKGRIYHDLRQHDSAIEQLNIAIRLNIKNGIAYYYRGRSYSMIKDYKNGLSDLSEAINLMPDIPEFYNSRGILYSKIEKTDESLEDYNKALELFPAYAETYLNRGNLYTQKGLFDEALDDYNASIEADPFYIVAYFARSQYYYGISEYKLALKDALYAKSRGLTVDEGYIKHLKEAIELE